ncbi:DUF2384 domain-containing protein [Mycobacterium sp. CBMA293]|uniref:antitoxin Xre/MbcA/ParS toxin-binding domain-containing protein n=1 Tax=unclassified Mycolicibacterium TaxID=2636767 RepID=UPI0012DDA316|nr:MULTISPECIES: antitoxin Xre/MbcA/ParS toxin-binding domain-containing protein [unclassified Mycolicibacterium]MUL49816.1 DUF2384 domain-containing protein [Mycolicibacterium sp. CBMA 360]MUL59643.1 DUF2384 domain-containing protein [Mycolicibacterium sp. CBMA 335]MUL71368.1 DUF2384 domain-containing protein [Mycolicibacterium sp. CBMA 311]MUL95011.1 DUF2384 domain-containing protein [Mycolicibacterium sp. CBMA 230]MUM03850.1 hypothetical protein [Mycolicibacterium sp. CBMA 213]
MTYRDRGGEYLARRLDDLETATRVADFRECMRRVDAAEDLYLRARLVWGEETVCVWFESPNAFLGGSRPLDVLYTDGPASVLLALDAEMGGGAA